MKSLLVMRHAKSDWSVGDQEDFDRPLNRRGRKDVPRVAGFLAANAFPDLVLASSAVRAQETATRLVDTLGDGAQLVLDGRLYGANPETLAQVAAATAGDADIVAVIAHNPGVEDWVAELTGAWMHLPTAAVARIDIDAGTWDGLGASRGLLRWLVTPKLLR